MKKGILISVALCATLVFGFQNCAKGTDTGNPEMSPSNSSGSNPQSLAASICYRLRGCGANISQSVCESDILNLNGLGSKFGATDNTATLQQLLAMPTDSTVYSRCEGEIMALTCQSSNVQSAYDGTSATPYAGVLNMIPTTGNCPNVY